MTKPDGVPADAEVIALSEFYRAKEIPSRLLPGLMQRIFVLACPACGAEHATEKGLTGFACGCGLSMKSDLTSLYVWRAPEMEAVS